MTNVGGTDGRYVLALNRWESNAAYTPIDRLGGELAAGESEVRLVDAAVPAEGESARYTLDVPGERGRRHHIISESRTTPE